MSRLDAPVNPRLPDPNPGIESAGYLAGLLSVLRLYFNRITNIFQLLLGPSGAQYIDTPNGLFFSTTTQAGSTSAQAIEMEVTYLSNKVFINAGTDSRVYVDVSGVYSFQFSGQLISTDSSAKTVYIWIVRNGTDIGHSTHAYSISGSGTQLAINWNFIIDMQKGDYLELEWASTDANVSLTTAAASSPHPGIPSAVLDVSYVSPLPAVLPTPP
jgi:hypothetical protein